MGSNSTAGLDMEAVEKVSRACTEVLLSQHWYVAAAAAAASCRPGHHIMCHQLMLFMCSLGHAMPLHIDPGEAFPA